MKKERNESPSSYNNSTIQQFIFDLFQTFRPQAFDFVEVDLAKLSHGLNSSLREGVEGSI